MNKTLLLLLLLISISSSAQNDKISFSYDTAGNQITRILCISCPSKNSKDEPKEIAAIKEEDLQKFSATDVLSYYPNPVKEELYLKWEFTQDNFVSTIQVFDLNGRILTSYSNLDKIDNQIIPFNNYPRGIYLVILVYKSGEEKNIKIIKQ